MMHEPPVKKNLYWCRHCHVPLLGRRCACGQEGVVIPLIEPYDVRPALKADIQLITSMLQERFGPIILPRILLLNKGGGIDRKDLILAHGDRFGWITFDPISRTSRLDITAEALPHILNSVTKGILDLEKTVSNPDDLGGRRIGGKRVKVETTEPDGTLIVKYRKRYGTGILRDGYVRIKELMPVTPVTMPNPNWDVAVEQNRFHLKNLERHAIRAIRQHMKDRPCVNVSFSGGKDSMAVMTIARKAGVQDAFFIDTGVEFPETIEFVRAQRVTIVPKGGDFWTAVEKAGPPGKDHRWCCKLLKLHPLKRYLASTGPCVTIQGNRWYESWNRADLDITSQNPANPLQLNISPIRNWRALEVFLYLRWQHIDYNPLYDRGIERIGCYVCPSMLESEYEELRTMHPELAGRWDAFLQRWAYDHGLPSEYARWGLWRWKELPPKMQELCRDHGIDLTQKTQSRKSQPQPVCETTTMENEEIRKAFPLLGDIIYLDSASTSLSPEPVLRAMMEFEHTYRSNVGRGVHRLAQIASQRYWHAHQKIARFIGADRGEVVFTRNSTEAINMVAQGLCWRPGDGIVTTVLEHHSNLLPWMRLRQKGVDVKIIGINAEYSLDLEGLEKAVTDRTRLVAVTHASNVLGVLTPVEEIARICHERGAFFLIDGAQSVPHLPTDVRKLGCDFLCFSGHKMLGPTGTGVLWMKEPILEPLLLGGGVIETVSEQEYVLTEGYQRYEAGTPNIAGGIGLGAAVDYLETIGMAQIRSHEQLLTERLVSGLRAIPKVKVYASDDPARRIGVVSFTIDGLEPHTIANMLDEEADIMVRSGHHCCMPLMQHLGLEKGTVRASLHVYNHEQDVDALIAAVGEIVRGM
ncbi:MAG: aminotransferase class V-fold PLP-dependent enzyme [Methanomicrobiales archaeon]|nr:aminotransferase class V-fold PLP-dependent enzyme [Methanomicrobiales archaeon]